MQVPYPRLSLASTPLAVRQWVGLLLLQLSVLLCFNCHAADVALSVEINKSLVREVESCIFSEVKYSGLVIAPCGFPLAGKSTEIYHLSVCSYLSPPAATVACDTLKRSTVSVFSIHPILRCRCQTKIASPVIEPIPVDVVNINASPLVDASHNDPMHKHRLLSGGRIPMCRDVPLAFFKVLVLIVKKDDAQGVCLVNLFLNLNFHDKHPRFLCENYTVEEALYA